MNMTNLTRSRFQAHPFHLVSPSPWPIYTCIALLTLTTCGVLSMHGFSDAQYFLTLAFILVVSSMAFWFRDVISEGKNYLFNSILSNYYNIITSISNNKEKPFSLASCIYIPSVKQEYNNEKELGYYLAGLLEGDGHISLPFKGKTILNRVLNPRIVFTSHKNDLPLYLYIQKRLGGIGRFQIVENSNVLRYIIGDIEGMKQFINIVHGKLRTPKNNTFNLLIDFLNNKYKLSIKKSNLDKSNLLVNSWFTGFSEADGHFGVKIIEFKPKLLLKRSVSQSISLKFRLDQRLNDKMTGLTMINIMEEIANCLSCNLKTYNLVKPYKTSVLSVNITAIDKLKTLVDYFDKYPLLGIKEKNFNDWKKVYFMVKAKQHLTPEGRVEIKLIQSNMNSRRIVSDKA